MNVVDFAYQIIALNRENEWLRSELDRLCDIEEKYNKLLDSSIEHGNKMMSNMLEALLNPVGNDTFLHNK